MTVSNDVYSQLTNESITFHNIAQSCWQQLRGGDATFNNRVQPLEYT